MPIKGVSTNFTVGQATISTTKGGGHPPEFWAERAVAKILGNSYNHLPPHVQEQARVFRERLVEQVLRSINSAIRSDRGTLAVQLEKQNLPEVAEFVRTYKRPGK
jgi:hypothetical protein